MTTAIGLYVHYKGGVYRVTGTARISTNGPDEGKTVVKYISLTTGIEHVRLEKEFHENVMTSGGPRPRFYLTHRIEP